MAGKGKYIYGIIADITGDITSKLKTEDFELISYKDILAVVSSSEIKNIANMAKHETATMLVHHQQTIEKIMNLGYSIVPMKLGTYGSDEDEVRYILRQGYTFICNILKEVSEKIEIDIIALWGDFGATLKEISEENKIYEFKQKLLADPTKITVDDQKQIGVMIATALGKKKKNYADRIHKMLKEVSVNAVPHEVMDEQMLLNTAFMINKHETDKFDGMVDKLNTEFENKLNFRYVGPLPCYSFFTIEVENIDSDKINWAKEKLGLKDSADIKEIKRAYKTKAMKLHPDKNLGKTGVKDDFDDLNKAYKTIIAYCITSVGSGERCSFIKNNIEKYTVIVKLKD